jgi:general secretion pathway protein I
VILAEKRSLGAQAIAARGRVGRSGFSLMEVILALAIFLMSLVAIAGLVDMGMERQIDSQLQVRATRLAQSKMSEIVSGALPMSATSGNFDNESEWSFNVNAQPYGPPNLYQVTVTVSRDNRGQTFEYTLVQMVINPTMTGSAQMATTTTDQGSATPPALDGTPPTPTTGTGSGGTP